MNLPHTRFSTAVDAALNRVGNALSWVWLVLLIIIVLNVTLRYLFDQGRIEFEEIQWHLYSVGFLMGLSYATAHDAHIRVDVLHENFSPRLQAWIELYGILLFLLPFVLLVLVFSPPFILSSWEVGEVSPSPGGLPYRWLIKAALPLGFLLLLAAACSRLTRVWAFLFLGALPDDPDANKPTTDPSGNCQ